MRSRALPLIVLVGAVAALVVSVGWAFARADDTGGWMMSRYGSGMMGLAATEGSGARVSDIAAARRQAQRFADRLDLRVGEMMRFSSNYYAELVERNGRRATEVLVDPATGAVWLEYGPAMMWNTRYGMMADFRLNGSSGMMGGGMMNGSGTTSSGMMGGGSGMMGGGSGMMGGGSGMMGGGSGMMGGGSGMMGSGAMMGGADYSPSTAPARTRSVSRTEARAIAQRWLDRNAKNLSAGEAEAFPGYYTLHTMRDGKVTGMLSVNAATGAVWFHWWHGRFVAMSA